MRRAVITGGSRRLGLYLTGRLLADQWHVTVLTRNASPELSALKQEHLSIVTLDYLNTDDILNKCDAIKEKPIDLLIHNASLFRPDSDTVSNPNLFKELFQVHMHLPVIINEALLDSLKDSTDANIVHMTDIYVENPKQDYSLYCASKAGLENLSKSYAKKLASQVRVNSIQPGPLKFLPSHTEEDKKEILSKTLIPIEAGFEPIYTSIKYLLSNPFVTGTSLKVDGGRTLGRD